MTERNRQGRLAGKVAIVTGAGTRVSEDPDYGQIDQIAPTADFPGTGRAISLCFAREGASVLLVDKSIDQAEVTLEAIRREGGRASIFQADVSDAAQCRDMADAATERYGALDILVNNVGIGGRGTVADITEETWDHSVEVNLKGMVFASKYAIPQMVKSGGGSIINLSQIQAGKTLLMAAKENITNTSTVLTNAKNLVRSQ